MNLLRALYTVYIGAVFFAICTVAAISYIPFSFLPGHGFLTAVWAFNRSAMRLWGWLCLMPIRIEGKDRRISGQAVVMVGNHCNMLDLPVTGSGIYLPTRVLAKKEFARIPILGFLMRRFCVLVARESAASRKQSAEAMVTSLRGGESILVFPEGTRNRGDTPLQSFKDGAFRAAIAAQVPVQPFVQLHMRCGQLPGTLFFQPHRLAVRFLDPISTLGMNDENVVELRERTRLAIETELRRDDDWFSKRFPLDS